VKHDLHPVHAARDDRRVHDAPLDHLEIRAMASGRQARDVRAPSAREVIEDAHPLAVREELLRQR